MCQPSRQEGPPVSGYWGRRPLYDLQEALRWAQERLHGKPYRMHPLYGKYKQAAASK
jgi:hypothetical protein